MRILVDAPGRVSEAVMALPALRSLLSGAPGARLTIVADLPALEVYRRSFGAPSSGYGALPEVRLTSDRRARTHRASRFDLGVTFTADLGSALFLWKAGARRRVGYATGRRGVFLTKAVPVEPTFGLHLAQQYYHLAMQAGGRRLPSCELLSVSDNDRRAADHLLRQNGVDPHHPFVALSPASTSGPARRWPPERYADLAQRIGARYDWPVVILGSREEGQLVTMVAEAAGRRAVDLGGRTTLGTLAGVLRRSRLLVANDSGAMHIGAGVGTKVVALFGSTDPGWTGPLGEGHEMIYHELSCSPCLQPTCDIGTVCFSSIRNDEVLDRVQQSLLTHWRVVPIEPPVVPSVPAPEPAPEPSEDDRHEEPPFRILNG